MENLLELLEREKAGQEHAEVKVYEKSRTTYENVSLLMVKENGTKLLLAEGEGLLYDDLEGEVVRGKGKVCPLTHENRLVLNRYFDFTVPQAFGTNIATMGLGDRLGLASPGHIETLLNRNVKPILGQQSIRELTLTNRSMTDMLDAAAFAVFQEGYTGGYGADADHIKEEKDIRYALDLGVSMLTLDCSDQIQKRIESASEAEVRAEFNGLPQEKQNYYNRTYLNKTFNVNGFNIAFDEVAVMKNVLLYGEAISFMTHVYVEYINKLDREFDFEISIDETETVTSPDAHFFVANELKQKGVSVASLAPRFCGEFQKGIDYIGDVEQFERELSEHASIAEYFEYKLSIHSGSDKFTVFPIIAKYTKGLLHIKTAGTSWLEAVRVIAKTNPDLYRRMHQYADDNIAEALKYYHITPDFDAIASLDEVSDEKLVDYLNDDNARQLLHVTYGLLLTAKDENGNSLFKDEFFNELDKEEELYREYLIKHIGRHVDTLGL